MCQNIKMLANSRQMSLNCVFFFCAIQSKPSLSHPRLVSYWQSWKSLAAALPDGGSALWSRRVCSAFPLQYLFRESVTCSRLATECVSSSGEWLMPRPFVVGLLFLTHGAQNWAKPFGEQLYCPWHFGSGATIIHFFMLQGAFFGVFFMKTEREWTGKYRKMF